MFEEVDFEGGPDGAPGRSHPEAYHVESLIDAFIQVAIEQGQLDPNADPMAVQSTREQLKELLAIGALDPNVLKAWTLEPEESEGLAA